MQPKVALPHRRTLGVLLALVGATVVVPATGAAAAPADVQVRAADATIDATLTDYHIALSSSTVPAGRVFINTMVPANASEHDLVLRDGPGTPELNPGQSFQLDAGVLADGTYVLYCDLPGHEELGMHTTLTVGAGGGGGGGGGPVQPPAVSSYVGLTPARVLDTRSGLGTPAGRVGAGAVVNVNVAGVAGVPADAGAVVLNVTSTDANAASFVTVWPAGVARPEASNLNTQPGVDTPNLVVVKVGAGGRVSLYNDSGSGHLIADVLGYFPAGSDFTGLTPARVLDTRSGLGTPAGRVGAGAVVNVNVAGVAGVPADAGAVVLNVTSTDANAASFVTVWPAGVARPEASNLNTQPGVDTPNLVVVKVGAGGRVSLYNDSGSGHLIADVLGYFPAGSDFTGLTPARVLDTRSGLGTPAGRVGAGAVVNVNVAGVAGVPADAGAVVLNVTSTDANAASFVTVWPAGVARPEASNLNTQPGVDTPNLVVVKVGAGGRVSLYNDSGSGHLIADVLGWFPA